MRGDVHRAAVAPERLGELIGHVTRSELDSINAALRLVFELDRATDRLFGAKA